MNYSDPGELSWVDEGLADMAAFLNGYPTCRLAPDLPPGLPPRDVADPLGRRPRELRRVASPTSCTSGSRPAATATARSTPDLEYDGAGGDLLIKLIFAGAGRRHGGRPERHRRVQRARPAPTCARPRTCSRTGRSRSTSTTRARTCSTSRTSTSARTRAAGRSTSPTTSSWTAAASTRARTPNAVLHPQQGRPARRRRCRSARRYETFRNPGPTFTLDLDGADESQVAPHSAVTPTGTAATRARPTRSSTSTAPVAGGDTLDFWTWYFIEEGWDYGFVEAAGRRQLGRPSRSRTTTAPTVTTDTNPHGNNTEGNGLTGTSGGAYFVDDPAVHPPAARSCPPARPTSASATRPTRPTSTPAGSWTTSRSTVRPRRVSSPDGDWFETTGIQDNNWIVQIVSSCDLTPGTTSAGETQDAAGFVYRFEGDEIHAERVLDQVHELDEGERAGRDLQPADRRPDDPRRGLRVPRHQHEQQEVAVRVPRRNEPRAGSDQTRLS